MSTKSYRLPLLVTVLFVLVPLGGLYVFVSHRNAVANEAKCLAEIQAMIDQLNQAKHLDMDVKLSPEAEETLRNRRFPMPQMLIVTRSVDREERVQYRLVKLVSFEPFDYAEIDMERSGRRGDFSKGKVFPVSFIYKDGQWLVGGKLRSGRSYVNPYLR